ncbi:cell wall protein Ecm33 [Elasticomyces elasticus]|nr:cell wall protein Ecm33 [Elasticomyces elasticus]KAK3651055.1 cell wall protein Ecm33 [Elasticomyces elasticus]KAK4931133.1 cell wall protein Ecm33 [Elasticomyces elasticus]KAK5765601.1 cell wall protein Ecm33 [Elasticomyces elasticus]
MKPARSRLRWVAYSAITRMAWADCSGTTTITDITGLTAIATCTNWIGDITVQSMTLGSTATPTPGQPQVANPAIALDSLEQIHGTLAFRDNIAFNGNQIEFIIQATNLSEVSGTLSIANMTLLRMPRFPSLAIARAISLQGLSLYDEVTFGPAQWPSLYALLALTVHDTNITELGGWNLSLAGKFNTTETPTLVLSATSNSALNNISLAGWSNTSSYIVAELADNGPNLHVDLPSFDTASLRVSDVAGFSAPDLITLKTTSSFVLPQEGPDTNTERLSEFQNNTFTALSLPALTTVTSTAYIQDNAYLRTLDLPKLSTLDVLYLFTNDRLENIAFPTLWSVNQGGLLSINSKFSNFSIPALTSSAGSLFLRSTGGYNCGPLKKQQRDLLTFKGSFQCTEAHSGLGTGALVGLIVGVVIAVLILAAITWILLRRRRKSRGAKAEEKEASSGDETTPLPTDRPENVELGAVANEIKELPPGDGPELPGGKVQMAQELETPVVRAELAGKQDGVVERHELHASDPTSNGWPLEKAT